MNLTEVTLAALNSRRSGRLRDELRCLFEDCCRQAVLVDACAVDEAAADRLAKALVGTKYAVVVVDGSDCLVVDREKVTTDCSDIRFVDVGADLEAPEVVDDARRLRTLNQVRVVLLKGCKCAFFTSKRSCRIISGGSRSWAWAWAISSEPPRSVCRKTSWLKLKRF